MEPRPAGADANAVIVGDLMALVEGAGTLQDAIALAQEAAIELCTKMVMRAARRLAEEGDADAKAFIRDMANEGLRNQAAARLGEQGLLPDNIVDFPGAKAGARRDD